jgi:hypothetical protein
MKRLALFLLLVFFLVGCKGMNIMVKDDPFKKSTVVTADIWHKVMDSKIDNQRVLYEKEIKNGQVTVPAVSFQFYAIIHPWWGYNGEDLGKEVYLSCDDKSFKVNLLDYRNLKQENVSGHGSTNAAGQYSASVSTTHTATMTGKIMLTPDIQKAIKGCNNFMYRFYVGSNTLTLQATSQQLEVVKKFLEVNASNIIKK